MSKKTINKQTLQYMLDEAQSVYHRLMMGEQVIVVKGQDGTSVTYSQASVSNLADYIGTLEWAIRTGNSPFGRTKTKVIKTAF